jgi:hypothetical protein
MAVVAGVGDQAEKIEHYSVIGAPTTDRIEVRFKLRDSTTARSLMLNGAQQDSASITDLVRRFFQGS